MGLICDTIVADVRDAKKLFAEGAFSPGWDEFEWTDTKGLMPEMLGTLLRVLDKKSTKFNQAKEAPEVHRESDNGGWVYKFPNELVKLLAQMDKRSVPKVTRLWIESDETLQMAREESYPFIEQAVERLRLISKKAVRAKKSLLLRIIL